MEINYKTGVLPDVVDIIRLYESVGLNRPTKDPDRMRKMFENSNLVCSAWDGERLVGVCRTITDWVWSSYLADLAVDPTYKKSGIGKALIAQTREKLGQQSMILLLSVPDAMGYYPNVGFTKEDRAFMINRTQ